MFSLFLLFHPTPHVFFSSLSQPEIMLEKCNSQKSFPRAKEKQERVRKSKTKPGHANDGELWPAADVLDLSYKFQVEFL